MKLNSVRSRTRPAKVCMVTQSYYELDNRVRRYAETLVRRGDQVDVVAVGRDEDSPREEVISGVQVYRIQNRRRDEKGKWTYAARMLRFVLFSTLFLARQFRRKQYDLIHVHNMPDFLVFSALYPKLRGAKVILDIHDIMPELFANKFKTGLESRYARLLRLFEKVSARFADHVIISNDLWREKLVVRSVPADKCSVFVNHVDPTIFYRRNRTRADDRLILLFPGTFQRHQGLDIAVEALGILKDQLPTAELHLYGGGDEEAELRRMAEQLGISKRVKFFSGVPLDQIAAVIANADIGIVPKRADSFGNEAYSTKIMEFMSQGIPVVLSRTKIDSFYFNDRVVRFFESGSSDALATAILDLVRSDDSYRQLVAAGLQYVEEHSWERNRHRYYELVDSLKSGGVYQPVRPSQVTGLPDLTE